MENLIFALNATVTVFILMVLGVVYLKLKCVDESFASKMNKFVFLVPLPVLVFKDLAVVDLQEAWNTKFVLFCFGATVLSILISVLISLLFDRNARGEFIQSSYRSRAALQGIAFIMNIYGDSGFAPLMIIGSVPLYNIIAVIVLSLFKPTEDGSKPTLDKALVKRTLIGIVTNPILIGIAVGLLWSALRIPVTGIFKKTVDNLSAMATPMGLIAMGAMFDVKKASGQLKPALAATFLKLLGFCLIFLPIAALLGFRNQEMVAILVMLGSATTVSSFVMARNMGHEGTVSSTVVMLTTVLAAFSLTLWLFLLRTMGLI